MILDLDRARRNGREAGEASGLTLEQRRDVFARLDAAGGDTGVLTLEEQEAYHRSLVIYTGGLGCLGVGTMPEDAPKCRAMEREHRLAFWGQA